MKSKMSVLIRGGSPSILWFLYLHMVSKVTMNIRVIQGERERECTGGF